MRAKDANSGKSEPLGTKIYSPQYISIPFIYAENKQFLPHTPLKSGSNPFACGLSGIADRRVLHIVKAHDLVRIRLR